MARVPLNKAFALKDHLAKKPDEAGVADPVETVAPTSKKEAADKRVQLMVRVSEEDRDALRMIALKMKPRTTVQALIEGAALDIIRRHADKTS